MAMFGRARDVSLFRHVNRELINNIITQQIGYYKYKLEATEDNLYGETPERYFTDPVLLNCLIVRGDQEWADSAIGSDFGPDESRTIGFRFLRDNLTASSVYILLIKTLILISEVDIAKIFIFLLARVWNIFFATPD